MAYQNNRFKLLLPSVLLVLLSVTACGGATVGNADSDQSSLPDTSASLDPTVVGEGELPDAVMDGEDTVLALAPNGVVISDEAGETQLVAFESDLAASTETIATVLGEPVGTTTNEECGAGPMSFTEFPNGFTVTASQALGQFAGWSVRPDTESADMITVDGVGLGSTLTELENAYSDLTVIDSTLGIEFYTESGLSGILSENAPDGTITYLWAGLACNFR